MIFTVCFIGGVIEASDPKVCSAEGGVNTTTVHAILLALRKKKSRLSLLNNRNLANCIRQSKDLLIL